MSNQLQPLPGRSLEKLESVIEAGVQTFVEVGQALAEIRERRLYREQGYATFEAYCRERWGWSKTHANRQIQAAEVARNLTPIGVIPASESQARELAALPPEQQRELAAQHDLRDLTAAQVRGAVEEKKGAHVAYNSGESEWYTPAAIIELARSVMGGIDLDPATHPDAQVVVQAARFHTPEEDGLARPWFGRVWLNPPYSQPAVGLFCQKLLKEITAGRVEAVITLTNNATETEWGQLLLHACDAVCFPKGRIRFWTQDKKESAPLQGQMLCYIGPNPAKFSAIFIQTGVCLRRDKAAAASNCVPVVVTGISDGSVSAIPA